MKKGIAFLTIIVYFLSQCVLASATQTNLWSERQKSIQVASLPMMDSLVPSFQTPPDISFPKIKRHFSYRFKIKDGKLEKILEAIPETSGTIRRVEQAPSKTKKVLVYIQDIHQNPEAQENIEKTVSELMKDGLVSSVALEGAFDKYKLEKFRQYSHQKSIHHVVGYLKENQRISGPMVAAFTSPFPMPDFVGVDDKIHYQANVQAYLSSRPLKNKVQNELTIEGSKLAELKLSHFTPALQNFDADVENYHQNKLSLGEYAKRLSQRESSVDDLSHVGRFLAAYELENTLDMARVEKERAVLLDQLTKRLSRAQLSDLMSTSVAFRLGRISNTDFYTYLNEQLKKHGLRLSSYPAMRSYFQYVALANLIDGDKLLSELSSLEKKAYQSLTSTSDEKTLVSRTQRLRLTQKLIDFSLSPSEWGEYKAFVMADASHPLTRPNELTPFENFYREAEIRDQLIAQNTLRLFNNGDTIALVTGGFHSDGITKYLKDHDVAVIQFTPKVTKVEIGGEAKYLSFFGQEKSPLEQLFSGSKLFTAPPPSPSLAEVGLLIGIQEASPSPNPGDTFKRVLRELGLLSTLALGLGIKRVGETMQLVAKNLHLLISFRKDGRIASVQRIEKARQTSLEWMRASIGILGVGLLAAIFVFVPDMGFHFNWTKQSSILITALITTLSLGIGFGFGEEPAFQDGSSPESNPSRRIGQFLSSRLHGEPWPVDERKQFQIVDRLKPHVDHWFLENEKKILDEVKAAMQSDVSNRRFKILYEDVHQIFEIVARDFSGQEDIIGDNEHLGFYIALEAGMSEKLYTEGHRDGAQVKLNPQESRPIEFEKVKSLTDRRILHQITKGILLEIRFKKNDQSRVVRYRPGLGLDETHFSNKIFPNELNDTFSSVVKANTGEYIYGEDALDYLSTQKLLTITLFNGQCVTSKVALEIIEHFPNSILIQHKSHYFLDIRGESLSAIKEFLAQKQLELTTEYDKSVLKIEKGDGIATITINRPDKLNALNYDAKVALYHAIKKLEVDPDFQGIVITGGGRAFVAGGDLGALKEFQNSNRDGRELVFPTQLLCRAIENCRVPVVAAVNGIALGGGNELAMAAHYRVASTNAKFAQPEILRGIMPGAGGTQRLVRLVGPRNALLVDLSGDTVSAHQAKVIGLVDEVIAPDNLLGRAQAIAKKLATGEFKTPQRPGEVDLLNWRDGLRSLLRNDNTLIGLQSKGGEASRAIVQAVMDGSATLWDSRGERREAELYAGVVARDDAKEKIAKFLDGTETRPQPFASIGEYLTESSLFTVESANWGQFLFRLEDGTEIRKVEFPQDLPESVRPFWKEHDALYVIINRELVYEAFIGSHLFLPFEKSYRTIGGTRFVPYATTDLAAQAALFLSQDMTRNVMMAGLLWDEENGRGMGGGKGVIRFHPASLKKEKIIDSYAKTLKKLGIIFTGQDMNISKADAVQMARVTPPNIIGPREGRGGVTPTLPTALGTYQGIEAAVPFAFPDNPTLEGKTGTLQGAGNVGSELLPLLFRRGKMKTIWVVDSNPKAIEVLRQNLELREFINSGRLHLLEAQDADKIYDYPSDIFMPCAKEWVLNENTIPRLIAAGIKLIAGCANDPLRRPQKGEDPNLTNNLARELHAAGIWITPDFVINAGGLLGVASGLFGYEVEDKLVVIPSNIKKIFEMALNNNESPIIIADRLADFEISKRRKERRWTMNTEPWKLPHAEIVKSKPLPVLGVVDYKPRQKYSLGEVTELLEKEFGEIDFTKKGISPAQMHRLNEILASLDVTDPGLIDKLKTNADQMGKMGYSAVGLLPKNFKNAGIRLWAAGYGPKGSTNMHAHDSKEFVYEAFVPAIGENRSDEYGVRRSRSFKGSTYAQLRRISTTIQRPNDGTVYIEQRGHAIHRNYNPSSTENSWVVLLYVRDTKSKGNQTSSYTGREKGGGVHRYVPVPTNPESPASHSGKHLVGKAATKTSKKSKTIHYPIPQAGQPWSFASAYAAIEALLLSIRGKKDEKAEILKKLAQLKRNQEKIGEFNGEVEDILGLVGDTFGLMSVYYSKHPVPFWVISTMLIFSQPQFSSGGGKLRGFHNVAWSALGNIYGGLSSEQGEMLIEQLKSQKTDNWQGFPWIRAQTFDNKIFLFQYFQSVERINGTNKVIYDSDLPGKISKTSLIARFSKTWEPINWNEWTPEPNNYPLSLRLGGPQTLVSKKNSNLKATRNPSTGFYDIQEGAETTASASHSGQHYIRDAFIEQFLILPITGIILLKTWLLPEAGWNASYITTEYVVLLLILDIVFHFPFKSMFVGLHGDKAYTALKNINDRLGIPSSQEQYKEQLNRIYLRYFWISLAIYFITAFCVFATVGVTDYDVNLILATFAYVVAYLTSAWTHASQNWTFFHQQPEKDIFKVGTAILNVAKQLTENNEFQSDAAELSQILGPMVTNQVGQIYTDASHENPVSVDLDKLFAYMKSEIKNRQDFKSLTPETSQKLSQYLAQWIGYKTGLEAYSYRYIVARKEDIPNIKIAMARNSKLEKNYILFDKSEEPSFMEAIIDPNLRDRLAPIPNLYLADGRLNQNNLGNYLSRKVEARPTYPWLLIYSKTISWDNFNLPGLTMEQFKYGGYLSLEDFLANEIEKIKVMPLQNLLDLARLLSSQA